MLEERAAIFRELAQLDALRSDLSLPALEDFITHSQALASDDRCKLSDLVSAR